MATLLGVAPTNEAERKVLKQLQQQLPEDWIVLPSVSWALRQNGYVRDGEADFVVLVPNLGLVVLEVKGTKEFEVREDGRWYRKDPKQGWIWIRRTPMEQACGNAHQLVSRLKELNRWKEFPGLFGYCVVYPSGEANQLPELFDRTTLITSRDLAQLKEKIVECLEARGSSSLGVKFESAIVQNAATQLTQQGFKVTEADSSIDAETDSYVIDTLTQQQYAAIRGIFSFDSLAVVGPAGSGKTLLALSRLRALLDEDVYAIFVCYNVNLAEQLRKQYPEFSQQIYSVDKLLWRLIEKAGLNPKRPSITHLSDYFRNELPELAAKRSTIEQNEKLDAIIIDEAQDFSASQLLALYDYKKDSGSWLLFSDSRQKLYHDTAETLIGCDVVFRLSYNCRNSVRINGQANKLLKESVESMPGMPTGVMPVFEKTANPAKRVWELINQFKDQQKIVVLGPYNLDNPLCSMRGHLRGYGCELVSIRDDVNLENAIEYSTIKSFKGLEADMVILVDASIPGQDPAFTIEDYYVAITRARSRLFVFSREELEESSSIEAMD